MKPTDILMDEHRVIEQVLNSLERMIDRATKSGRLEEEPAREAIEFFRMFADHCHHGKEEAAALALLTAEWLVYQRSTLARLTAGLRARLDRWIPRESSR